MDSANGLALAQIGSISIGDKLKRYSPSRERKLWTIFGSDLSAAAAAESVLSRILG